MLIELIDAVADAGSVEEAAKKRDKTPLQWWRDHCADAGLDECEPWLGFPGPHQQKDLPAPGDDSPLSDEKAHLVDKLEKLLGPTKQ